MAASGEVNTAVLSKFAQKLAGNEKKFRDRAVKMLRKWLSSRSQGDKDGLTYDDFLKIWKGLHYCMWMSDKPLVQEELAVNISELVHSLSSQQAVVDFLNAFFQTEAREWFKIDRLRLDKFMMLIRKVVRESFVFLRREQWADPAVKAVLDALCQTVLSPEAEAAPEGLRLHIADIYLDELTAEGAEELSEEQVFTFLDPYCIFISKSKSTSALHRVIKEVFFPLVGLAAERLEKEKEEKEKEENEEEEEEEEEEESDEEEPSLKVDYEALADRLFALASDQSCRGKNRKPIYSLVKTFKNLAQGIPPEVHEIEAPPSGDQLDYNSAVQRLKSFEEKLMAKTGKVIPEKRKKGGGESTEDTEQDAPPKKKKKKDKTPQLNGFHQEEDEEAEPEPAKTEKSKKKLKKQKEHIENPAKKAQKLKKLNKKKQKVEAEELSADEDGDEVVVLNAQSEDGGTKTEVRDTSATSPNSMAAIRRAILEMQKGKKGLEQPLFAGGFEDSDDEANIINDSIDTTPKSKKKKKGKKAKKAQETDEGAEGEDFESLEDSVVERLSGGESPENGSAKKKKKKQRKLSIASADAEEIIQTATPTSAKSKKKAKAVQNGAEELEEEIEVFVPNKKYKGALKEGFEREMKKSLGKTEASFASFETGAKTPVAFVRRAMSKLKTPKSEPRKSRKQSLLDESMESAKKRRVSFGLDHNRAQDFADSLNPSPVVPFDPNSTPDKTILKVGPKKRIFTGKEKAKMAT